jgi:CBS domain-containing protein
MRAGELCTREVCVARAGDALVDAAREMLGRHVGAIVVIAPERNTVKPIGIVTDRDIVCGQLARGADMYCLTVGDVMSTDLTTVGEDDEVAEVIKRLAMAGIRRAPVVNGAGDLVGILSLDDVLPVVSSELAGLARLIGVQSRAEA